MKAIFVEGRNATARDQAWAAADIFVSLSDNIQETFGLTPIEAMAAGLPVVVTDWNGYQATRFAHGVDGYPRPHLGTRARHGQALARGLESRHPELRRLLLGRRRRPPQSISRTSPTPSAR